MTSLLIAEPPFLNPEIMDQLQLIMTKGGVMMFPLAICSFIVMLITLERILALRSGRLVSERHLRAWENWFENEMADIELPQQKSASIPGSMLKSLAASFPLPQTRLEERLLDLARREKHRLERGLVFLDTIAGIAPLFGLLGTALGMVEVFSRLSMVGEAKMSALSSGISQALYTTVAGLCIGIPSLIAFNLFSRHIEKILIQTEDQLNRLIDRYYPMIVKEQA